MLRYPVRTSASAIQGTGVFAAAPIRKRSKIGEVTGEVVSRREARRRGRGKRSVCQVDVTDTRTLDCTRGNCLKYLNHSCDPNTYLRIFRERVEVYALRNIKKGEELTADYGATPYGSRMRCACGRKGCRGRV